MPLMWVCCNLMTGSQEATRSMVTKVRESSWMQWLLFIEWTLLSVPRHSMKRPATGAAPPGEGVHGMISNVWGAYEVIKKRPGNGQQHGQRDLVAVKCASSWRTVN